jgi:hypothetical protein
MAAPSKIGYIRTVGILAGCQGPSIFGGSTGVLTMGPDTYTITENVILSLGGAVASQGKCHDYCEGKGREFLALNYQTIPQGGSVSFSLTFRCLLPNDPELRRPNFKPAPNVVIENRQR